MSENLENDSLLLGRRVAIIAAEGFEESELLEPRKALDAAGAETEIISIKGSPIRSWKDGDWGQPVDVDNLLSEVDPADYDCLLIPGGVLNPDKMRVEKDAVQFVKHFLDTGKPVAAICHGPQLLIETGLLNGKIMTSYKSIKTDLVNAGAEWTDEEVVIDGALITSRSPKDIPAFNKAILAEFVDGRHFGLPNTEGFSATL
jgi:protease I